MNNLVVFGIESEEMLPVFDNEGSDYYIIVYISDVFSFSAVETQSLLDRYNALKIKLVNKNKKTLKVHFCVQKNGKTFFLPVCGDIWKIIGVSSLESSLSAFLVCNTISIIDVWRHHYCLALDSSNLSKLISFPAVENFSESKSTFYFSQNHQTYLSLYNNKYFSHSYARDLFCCGKAEYKCLHFWNKKSFDEFFDNYSIIAREVTRLMQNIALACLDDDIDVFPDLDKCYPQIGNIGMSLDQSAQDSIDTLAEGFTKFVGKMPEADFWSELNLNFKNLSAMPAHFAEKQKEVVDEAFGGLGKNIMLVGILFTGYQAISTGEKKWCVGFAAGVVVFCATYGLPQGFFSEMLSKVRELVRIKDEEVLEPHSLGYDLLPTLATTVFNGYSMYIMKEMPSATAMTYMSNRLSNFKRTNEGLLDFMAWCKEVFENFVVAFKVKLLGDDYSDVLDGIDPTLKTWCKAVEDMQEASEKQNLEVNRTNAERISNLLGQSRNLMLKGFKGSQLSRLQSVVRNYTDLLRKMADTFAKCNVFANGPRTEPLMILLTGGTGVGKSWVTIPLIIHLLKEVLCPADRSRFDNDFNSFVYSRQQEHKYWDGYISNFVTVFDDFGQVRDSVGTIDSEIMDLIRCGNIFPNMCHMAHLDQKGTTFWCSKIIVCSSNLQKPDFQSINCPAAVWRRFDVIANVSTKHEYTIDGKMDPQIKGVFNPEIYDFERMNYDDPDNIQSIGHADYGDFLSLCVTKFLTKQKHGNNYLAKIDEMVKSPCGYVRPAKIDKGKGKEIDCSPQIWIPFISGLHQHTKDSTAPFERVDNNEDMEAAGTVAEFLQQESVSLEDSEEDSPDYIAATAVDDSLISQCEWSSSSSISRVGNIKRSVAAPIFDIAVKISDNSTSWAMKYGWRIGYENASHSCANPECLTFEYRTLIELATQVNTRIRSKMQPQLQSMFDNDTRTREAILVGYFKNSCQWFPRVYMASTSTVGSNTRFSNAVSKLQNLNMWILNKISLAMKNYPKLFEALKWLSIAGSLVYVVKKIYSFYIQFTGGDLRVVEDDAELIEDQSHTRDHKTTTAKQRKMRRGITSRPQNFDDLNSTELLNRVARRNLYYFSVPKYSPKKQGHVLFLKGRIAIMPGHFFNFLNGLIDSDATYANENVKLVGVGSGNELNIPIRCILDTGTETEYLQSVDAGMFCAPTWVHPHSDITKFFVTEANWEKPVEWDCEIVTGDDKHFRSRTFKSQRTKDRCVTSPQYGDWKVARGVWYSIGTVPGDCGAPVFFHNKAMGPGKILGFHVAGHNNGRGVGICNIMTKEDIDECIQVMLEYDTSCATPLPEELNGTKLGSLLIMPGKQCEPQGPLLEGTFVPLGEASRPVNRAMRTKIVKSALYGAWGPTWRAPAKLRSFTVNGKEIDPMAKAIARYGCRLPIVDVERASEATRGYFNQLYNCRRTCLISMEPITFEQAVIGVPGVAFFDAMPRNTSAGFPHVMEVIEGLVGKQRFFGKEIEYDLKNQECVKLKSRVENLLDNAAVGVRGLHVYIDCLKDEVRKISSVEEGKTRLFCVAPTEMLIAFRMMFLPFNRFVMSTCIANGIAVGINPYSNQWSELVSHLCGVGEKIFDGDIANMDGTEHSDILRCIGDEIIEFMGGSMRDREIRRVLFFEVFSSIHINGSLIYQWTQGLPSGNPLTVIINSIMVHIYIRMAWNDLIIHGSSVDLGSYDDNIRVVSFGDDALVNVSDEASPHFNGRIIALFLSTIGVTLTDANKSLPSEQFVTINDVVFLKRKFVYDAQLRRWVAPLDLQVIMDSPYWIMSSYQPRERVLEKAHNSLDELALHPKSIFAENSALIIDAMGRRLHFRPEVTDYATLRARILQRSECWCVGAALQNLEQSSAGLSIGVNKPKELSPATNSTTNVEGTTKQPTKDDSICDIEETTCFENDRPGQTSSRPNPTPGSTLLTRSVSEPRDHTIVNFLRRPIQVSSLTWTTSQVKNTIVGTVDFPDVFLSSTMYSDKITNFFGFRADVKLRFIINCERFQQGRMLFCWFPQRYENQNRAIIATSSVSFATQLPRVEFDVSTDSESVLDIPYVSPYTHYNVVDQIGSFGRCYAIVYSPLLCPSGTTSVTVQIWANCENIDLAYPARPQMMASIKGNRSMRRSKAEKELEAAGTPTISSLFDGAAHFATSLSNFPLLTGIFAPAAWALGITSKALSAIGFSKPHSSTPPHKIKNEMFSGMTNANWVDQGSMCGVLADNQVSHIPNYCGTQLDELSISYLAGIPAYWTHVSWDMTRAADYNLDNFSVTPSVLYSSSTVGTYTMLSPTPIYYVSNMFNLWRGSITYTFKIVKTEFHTGRLMFFFDPGHLGGSYTVSNTEGLYRQIFDLRLANEFVVTVPFVSPVPYRAWGDYTGTAGILVETPLRAPSSVTNFVDIIIEVCAGPDIEFASPVNLTQVPVDFNVVSPASGEFDFPAMYRRMRRSIGLDPQILGTDVANQNSSANISLVAPLSSLHGAENASEYCIGEKIISLRQMLKRFVAFYSNDTNSTPFTLFQWLANQMRQNYYPKAGGTTGLQQVDYIDYIGAMFAYRRGGVSYKVFAYNSAGTQIHYTAIFDQQYDIAAYPSPVSSTISPQAYPLSGAVVSVSIPNGGIEVVLPPYAQTATWLNQSHIGTILFTPAIHESTTTLTVVFSAGVTSVRMYRAAAEDCTFGYFIGTMPLVSTADYANQTFACN